MAKKQVQAQDMSRKEWQEKAAKKIQGSSILNKLINHIDSEDGTMSSSQVHAARSLLNKMLPDLKSTELTGKDGEDLIPKEYSFIGKKSDSSRG